jgi:tetratricopeptide (TPR) repeat protein
MRILFLFLVLGIPLSAFALHAAEKNATSLQVREKAAKKACAIGDYQKGIEILADLYVDTNEPTYVFNQGRCYQQNSRFEQAIDRFREFLRKMPNLTAEDKAGVENHIADCEELLRKTALASQSSQPEASPPAPAQTIPHVDDSPTQNLESPAITSERAGSGLRAVGLVSIGIGMVASAAGVYFNLQAENLADEIEKPESGTYSKKEKNRADYRKWGLISYGVGAATIVTGTILYIVGRTRGTNDSAGNELSFLPSFAPGGAGLIMRGGF